MVRTSFYFHHFYCFHFTLTLRPFSTNTFLFTMSVNNLKLESYDGEIIDLPVNIANCSGFLKDLLQDLPKDSVASRIIPVTTVDTRTLQTIKLWYISHISNPVKYDRLDLEEQLSINLRRDFGLSELDPELLLNVLKAADYLAFEELLETACWKAAEMIKKDPLITSCSYITHRCSTQGNTMLGTHLEYL